MSENPDVYDPSSSGDGHNNGHLHDYAFSLAGAFAFWATLLSLHLVYKHSRNYTQPNLQRPIIRIIFMVPVSKHSLLYRIPLSKTKFFTLKNFFGKYCRKFL